MMIWTILILLSVSNLQTAAATELPQISLSSPLPGGQGVCPGDEIKFTCVTNGSGSHAWMSDEFIGRGGIQLEFASFDSPGVVRRKPSSPMGTLARLNVKDIQENETKGILESELNVIASSEYPVSSVSCLYVDSGLRCTRSIPLLDKPGEPQDVEVIQRPSNGDRCDFSVQLNPPTNIDRNDIVHYIVMHQIGSVEITGTSGSFFVPMSNCTTDLRVRVAAVNRCGMQGNITGEIVPRFIVLGPTAGIEDGGQPIADGVSTAALVVIVVLVVVLAVIAVVIIIICTVRRRCKQKSKSIQQAHDVKPPKKGNESSISTKSPVAEKMKFTQKSDAIPLSGAPPPSRLSTDEILKKIGSLLLHVVDNDGGTKNLGEKEKQKLIKAVKEYIKN